MAGHRVGIIGCGAIGNLHAAAIGDIRGCRVAAVADVASEAAERLAKRIGCDSYDDYRRMLGRDDVDVVTICTPSGAHLQPAVAAARAGKHVIVEKPLEITLGRCDRIIAACRQAGVALGTIFPMRFGDAAQLVRKTVAAGRLGTVALGNAYVRWWRTQQYYDSGGWRGTWRLEGGGAIMTQAIHAIDLLLWYMGPVASVRAVTATRAHKRIEVEDVAVAALTFRNGALGTIEGTTGAFPGSPKRIVLCGDGGTIVQEDDYITTWQFRRGRKGDAAVLKKHGADQIEGSGASDPMAISHEGHRRQFVDFMRAVDRQHAPAIDGAEGRKAVELVVAIYKSARTGRAVNLPLR